MEADILHITDKPELKNLKITSPSFENNSWIPTKFSGYGEDLSPELIIEGIAKGAKSMAVILDDLEHPIFPGYNHWLAWNLTPIDRIPQGLPKGAVIDTPIHAEQGLAYGKHCYRGPKPPFNWNHRYRFTVYTLDTMLSISTDSNKSELLRAMEGHMLQKGELYGSYQRKHN